ncbi:MAG: hypothetical protein PHD66_03350 [Eubacteriales bacterium]|nr:hypothetical protein [Eubacteriales bacterium]
MKMPTHIVAAAGYVFDNNGKVIYSSYITRPEFKILTSRFI